jgi:DNA-binding NarL/FixJ family response regulator
LRVAIAEDSVLLREGLARLLDDAGFDVVAQCADADDLLLKVRSYSPDVAIVDIRLPPTHNDEGLRAALEIRSKHPGVAVLVLSQYVELGLAMKLLADSAEGVGYLLKDRISDVNEFVAALRRVGDGGSALDPIIVTTLVSRQRPDDPLAQLTPREREVLELMASGASNQGIADKLVITVRAVEKYVSSIFTKLGLPSTGSESRRVLAVLTFLRSGAESRLGNRQETRPSNHKPAAFPRPAFGASVTTYPEEGAEMKTRVIQDEPEPTDHHRRPIDVCSEQMQRAMNIAGRMGRWSAIHWKTTTRAWASRTRPTRSSRGPSPSGLRRPRSCSSRARAERPTTRLSGRRWPT